MKFISVAGIVLGVALIVVGIFGSPPLSDDAEAYASEVAEKSAKTYLALRVLNAGISVAEEVEISGGIGVASGAVQPFKLLEPLDDAVERLSDAVFALGVVAALFSILMPLLGAAGVLLLGAGILGMSLVAISGNSKWLPFQVASLFVGVARAGGLLFAALVVFVVGGQMGTKLSERAWDQHSDLLISVSEEISTILEADAAVGIDGEPTSEQIIFGEQDEVSDDVVEAAKDEGGWLDSISGVFSSASEVVSETYSDASTVVGSGFEKVKEISSVIADAGSVVSIVLANADELTSSMTLILASFLLELLLVPILFFLIVMKIERSIRPKL